MSHDTPTTSTFKSRVLDEARELNFRIVKLYDFIRGSAVYRSLSVDEKIRLHQQLSLMRSYHSVLLDRIRFMTDPATTPWSETEPERA